MDNHNPVTADKAKWYETRRNELLKLLEKTSKVEIPEKYAQEMGFIRKKCLENQFEIVLVGEFQGGKSTTFNALCDGRDLSPRGLGGGGIKTSAAIISAQNISDNETKAGLDEWAEITFKTKYEIQKGMFDLLRDALIEDKPFKDSLKLKQDDFISAMSDPSEFARLLDLDSPVHRKAVKTILSQYWEAWSQDKASLDEDTKDRLRIATLQERFYGTKEYEKLLSRNVLGLSDFQPLIAFPSDWIIRWKDGKEASFTWEEAAFVFIARVLLRIKSESLAKLGCRITDCPGLFANAYDTAVARGAISNADAVWYLIGGEKQIGAKDIDSLEFIKRMGMISKVISSVNLRLKNESNMNLIFQTTQNILRENKFTFPVLRYNAKLAFLARQGIRVNKGDKFSEYEQNCMRIDSELEGNSSTDEMWLEMVNNLGTKEYRNIEKITDESVQKVLDGSHIEEILSFLSQEIITKKSHSILIDNGSKKAADALQEYEGQLKMSEDAALQDKAEWEKKVQENQTALENFIRKSKDIVEDSTLFCEKRMMSKALASELVKSSLNNDFAKQVTEVIAKSVFSKQWKPYLSKKNYKEAIMKETAPEIGSLAVCALQRTLESWKTGIENEGDNWQVLKHRLNRVSKDIKKLWEKESENQDYIKDLQLNLPTQDDLATELTAMQNVIFDNKDLLKTMDGNRLGIGTILLAVILSPILLWVGWCALIDYVFSVKDSWSVWGSIKKEFQEQETKTKESLYNTISSGLKSDELRALVSEKYIDVFERIQDSCLKNIERSIDNLLICFKADHVDPAKRNLNESERRRKEIAEKNHNIRKEQIEPLRKEIRAFEQRVTAELNLK